tara:strand:- start:22156 stop:22929 length:774 start_codon:yes stop_codon:yes gene_type:complete
MTEKLQKVLARAGFGSRREIETWIAKGRIKVNGKVAVVGDRVTDDDKIIVDGKKLAPQKKIREDRRVILYNKPENEVSTRSDPEGRRTVFDSLPPLKHGRWISIGRLDLNTSGLMLFTTDGELANKLMHPSSQIEREYAVRILGDVTPEMVEEMHKGVIIEDHLCRFTDIQHYGGEGVNQWYHVVLMEGRNREVRKLWESQGVKVSRLKRVRFGPLFIPSSVVKGRFNELGKTEIDKLLKLVQKESEQAVQKVAEPR